MGINILLYLCIIISLMKVVMTSLQSDIATQMNKKSRALSRKRRYLIFPEGSSLQLVFCLTYPSVGMGQIFVFGSTAALAWELPHDPFVPFRKEADALHRIDTVDTTKKPKRPPKINKLKNTPNYSKYPPVIYHTINSNLQTPAKKKNYYDSFGASNSNFQHENVPITTYFDPVFHQIHRRTRRELFGKIEKLFKAQKKDGKACLLKSICEVTKAPKTKGSFLEEILKTVFKPKPHDGYGNEDEYDFAANEEHDCDLEYPTCEFSIFSL